MAEVTGDKIKIVERAGVKLKQLLTRADPFDGLQCASEKCLVCRNPFNRKFGCNKRSVTYKTYCLKCKEKLAEAGEAAGDTVPVHTYYGETHVSSRERGIQHERDYRSKNEDSHMYKHYSEMHQDENLADVKFGMSVIRQHFSSFSRQIHEACLIFLDGNNLNSKQGNMYNRCKVPRLTTMIQEEKTEEKKEISAVVDDEETLTEDQVKFNKRGRKASEEESVPNINKRPRKVLKPRLKATSKVGVIESNSIPVSKSSKKSNFEEEAKSNPKTKVVEGASNFNINKSKEGDNFLISNFFKPVPGKASAADKNIKFYPPD